MERVMAEPLDERARPRPEVTPAEPVVLEPLGDGPSLRDRRDRHRHQGLDRAQPARARRDGGAAPLPHHAPRSCWRATPTPSSSPTAPATRRRSTTSSRACAAWSARSRCGASAWATSSCAGPSGSRPSSCPSATAARTTRSRTSRPGGSRSPPRTTASRCSAPTASARSTPTRRCAGRPTSAPPSCPSSTSTTAPSRAWCSGTWPGATVQYHPEAGPGPARLAPPLRPLPLPPGRRLMPRRDDIHKILVLGSGPIVIGQAAEFDYSGAQACKVLLEEGYEVVLVNSNPATIMTDPEFATATYIEPLTPASVARVIERERPDALLPTLGGGTALNVARDAHRGRHARALRRGADRRRLRRDPPRGGPRPLPRDHGRRRPARAAFGGGRHAGRGRARAARHRPSRDRAPGLHHGRRGRRHRPHRGRVPRAGGRGPGRQPDRPGADRRVGDRLGRVRARADARPQRQRGGRSARSRTWTRWACTPATRSPSPPSRRCPIASTRRCATRRSR